MGLRRKIFLLNLSFKFLSLRQVFYYFICLSLLYVWRNTLCRNCAQGREYRCFHCDQRLLSLLVLKYTRGINCFLRRTLLFVRWKQKGVFLERLFLFISPIFFLRLSESKCSLLVWEIMSTLVLWCSRGIRKLSLRLLRCCFTPAALVNCLSLLLFHVLAFKWLFFSCIKYSSWGHFLTWVAPAFSRST